MKLSNALAVVVALTAGTTAAYAGAFSSGNLVVLQVGDGAAALSGTAQTSSLREFTRTGTAVQTIGLPTLTSPAQRALTFSGTATSEGALTLSADGRYLTLAGYDAAPGSIISNTTAAAVNRVIGRVGLDGVVDTSTVVTDNPSGSGANMRSAVSADGSGFWFTGGGSATGVRYTTFGSQGTSTQVTASPGNTRIVNIFNNQLYTSAGSAGFVGITMVGVGLPTTSGTISNLINASGASPYDFIIVGQTTMYVADDSATSTGLSKFTFNGSTWSLNYRISAGLPASGLRQITGGIEGSDYVIYGTSGDGRNLVRLVDTGAASSFNTIATAATNTVFRGVDFVPVPTPGALALLGLGGIAISRRRR